MARLRAVVVIQPPGLGGRPSAGHLRRATANASWTASSARSMSPNDADQGGHRSAGLLAEDPADLGLVEPGVRRRRSRKPVRPRVVPERADLDRSPDDARWSWTPSRARRRDPRRRRCRSRRGAPSTPRTARRWSAPRRRTCARRWRCRVRAAAPPKTQAPADFISSSQGHDPLHDLAASARRSSGRRARRLTVDAVDGQQVLRHGGPPRAGRALPASHPSYERASPRLTLTQEEQCSYHEMELPLRE